MERIFIKKIRKKENDKDASKHIDASYSEGVKENVLLACLFFMRFL